MNSICIMMCWSYLLYLVDANTSVSSGDGVVSVIEGGNVDISCISTGVPVPTITWTLNNQTISFTQTDTPTNYQVTVTGEDTSLVTVVTPGNVVSTLHIVNAQYPANTGEYVCTGSNTHAGITIDSPSTIIIGIQGNFWM